MKVNYWKRESIVDGEIIALFKIEEKGDEISGYIYKDGKWEEHNSIVARAGYDDEYDWISEEEAKQIMKKL